ncbi:MAG TPA: hypothetical protein VH020_11850 [Stellaceae bacterium]|jgi:hypothetical protein|nr:hypothetical protein [Stellaceae bacterium]
MSSNEPNDPPPSAWGPATLEAVDATKPGISRQQQAIAVLVLVLAIVIAAVATSPFWAPGVASLLPWGRQAPADDRSAAAIHDLESRLDAEEAALKQQATRLSRLNADELALKDQAARLATLEARPEAPATTPAPAAQPVASEAAIKALQEQLAKLTTNSAATGDRLATLEGKVEKTGQAGRADRALLLSLANLRVAVEGTAPFPAELAAAQSLAGDSGATREALASLGDDAKSGLPSLALLTEQFDRRVAPAILRARGETTSKDWWGQIQARLERLVVIRRIAPGGAEPRNTTEAAVARADAALKAADLAGAAAALDRLSGGPAAAAAAWVAQAKKRVAAEVALANLWQAESARVAAASRGDKP